MKKVQLQQRRERRIAAALRLVLVAVLLAFQIAVVVLLSFYLQEHAAIVYAALQMAGLVAAILIYNRRDDAMYKFSWIIVILTVPVVGLILYFLWGGNTQRKRLSHAALQRFEEPESVRMRGEMNLDRLSRASPDWTRLAKSLSGRGFSLHQNTRTHYFADGKELLEDLISCCEKAEHFIFLEYFILAEGKIWERLSPILCEKSKKGIEVKIIFDDFGNIRRFSADALEQLRSAEVEALIFNPVHKYVNRLYFNYRDHRKIAVIDGNTAFTGGVNIADEYANLINRFGYWKDGGIRLQGDGVWGLTSAFMEMWCFLGGTLHRENDYYRPHTAVRAEGLCQPFTDGPQNNPDNPAEDVYLQLISNAKRFLYITTPYFIPDDSVMRALCIAGDGGVDVRLMLPGTPDHRYTDLVAESYFGDLIAHGVKVYRYTPGFLHSKSIMVDREVAVTGSINMDYRSFDLHYECGVVLYSCPAIEDMLEDMDAIVSQSHQVTREEWAARSLFRRIVEPLLRIFAIWM